MAQPTAYTRAYDFEGFQTSNPSTPLPAAQVETELNRIKTTLDETLANLAIIQRDDTEIANNSVGIDQLKTEVTFGLNAVTDWETATAYALNAGVWNAGKLYYCIVAHTSGTFATDLAAEKWSLILDVDTTLAAYVTNAQAAQTAAETAQGLSETARDASVTAQGLSEAARDAAVVAQGLAEAARDAAIAAFDNFDDIYLGAKAADPTLDNDGDPLAAGMLYYNTGSNEMKVYSGASWANLGAGATAATVSYDNSTSGLTATDVQAAIDEIDAYLDSALAAGAIANSQLANMAEATIKGRAAGSGTGAPVDLTSAQATALLDAMVGDSGSGGTKGLVPAPSAGDATKFLTGAGTYTRAGGFTLATAQTLTSGASVDFTSIPAGTKQIVIGFHNISTSGTSPKLVQIGDSGGIENTGYLGNSHLIQLSAGFSMVNSSDGFPINSVLAADTVSGSLILTLVDAANFIWAISGTFALNTAQTAYTGGSKALSAELDRVRITTVGGTDTFDAGTISIAYQ